MTSENRASDGLEVSILIPCLNEAETIAVVVRKVSATLRALAIVGEVVVADNGSTDGSQGLAAEAGARVVAIAQRGYGAALIGGIAAAQGQYVIMGDADDSYDFTQIAPFIDCLRAGAQLVMGTRMKGTILPGAMPPLHRYLGNPVLTAIGNLLFNTRISDYHCGLRAFSRDAVRALDLRTTGMEFATEMVAKAALSQLSIAEIPITYHPDGRSRAPHLRTWSDGWRHLKFMLLISPVWVFLYPGMLVTGLGLIGLLAALVQPIGGVEASARELLPAILSSVAVLAGVQIMIFGVLSRLYANKMGLLARTPFWDVVENRMSMDTGLLLGGGVTLAGGAAIAYALSANQPRLVIAGLLILTLGIMLVFLSFVVSLIRIQDYFE